MNNAAFEENNGTEAARILRALATRIEDMHWPAGDVAPCIDINGNTVGAAKVIGDEKRHDNSKAIADWNRRHRDSK